MNLDDIKVIAIDDVLRVGPETIDEKLVHYTDDAVVWDPVVRVAGYAPTNSVSGLDNVKKFFTWLANLPPVEVKILNVFGEKNKVCVEWLLIGGREDNNFKIPCVNIYDFFDKKISNVRMHFDSAYFSEISRSN